MLLARGPLSPLVSLYSFTMISTTILKQVFLSSGHWMNGFIASALPARQKDGCKFFQRRCNVTWYRFYAVCFLCLKWPFLNAYFQQGNWCLLFPLLSLYMPMKSSNGFAIHNKSALSSLLKLPLVSEIFLLDSWTAESAGDSISTRWESESDSTSLR